ncbi:hypothetical protein ABPG74_020520 [Tetrahymena malaccensis]
MSETKQFNLESYQKISQIFIDYYNNQDNFKQLKADNFQVSLKINHNSEEVVLVKDFFIIQQLSMKLAVSAYELKNKEKPQISIDLKELNIEMKNATGFFNLLSNNEYINQCSFFDLDEMCKAAQFYQSYFIKQYIKSFQSKYEFKKFYNEYQQGLQNQNPNVKQFYQQAVLQHKQEVYSQYINIHSELTLEQIQQLLKLDPELQKSKNFISFYTHQIKHFQDVNTIENWVRVYASQTGQSTDILIQTVFDQLTDKNTFKPFLSALEKARTCNFIDKQFYMYTNPNNKWQEELKKFDDIEKVNLFLNQLQNMAGDQKCILTQTRIENFNLLLIQQNNPFASAQSQGFQLLAKLQGVDFEYNSNFWKDQNLLNDQDKDINKLQSAKYSAFNNQKIKQLFIIDQSGRYTILELEYQQNLTLPEIFTQDLQINCKVLEGCKTPLELTIGYNQTSDFYEPCWRINSYSTQYKFKYRIGGNYHKTWAAYGQDRNNKQNSAEMAGLGLSDEQWNPFSYAKKSYGIRAAHDQLQSPDGKNQGQFSGFCILLGK